MQSYQHIIIDNLYWSKRKPGTWTLARQEIILYVVGKYWVFSCTVSMFTQLSHK